MIITTIDTIPLFSTLPEALQWAVDNNFQGYHTHVYNGQLGYMGGKDHNNVTNSQSINLNIPNRSSGSASTPRVSSTPSSGGGGGGY